MSPDDAGSAELLLALIAEAYKTLLYVHSESTHRNLLLALDSEHMRRRITLAGLAFGAQGADPDIVINGIKHQARKAREAGLVKPDGCPRKRRARAAEVSPLHRLMTQLSLF